MANRTGKVGRPWVKGQTGNAGGRPKVDPIIKQFKETTYSDFIEHLQKYGNSSRGELEDDLSRPETTMFEHIFGKILLDASKGDRDARNVLLDRLWGKVKDKIEHSSVDNTPQIVISLPDNGRQAPPQAIEEKKPLE